MPASLDPTFPLFPICSGLGFILSVLPLSWHIQAWNSGTCAFMIWTAIACVVGFVNSLVWMANIDNPAPIWCDVSTKLMVGVSAGIPAATLCISRRLFSLIGVQQVTITRQDKRRMIIDDLCIAAGLPILVMILHVIVQPHRFDIYEGIGCYPVIYNTLLSYFTVYLWPPVLGLASFTYSSLTLRSFWRRRAQFSQLVNRNSSMTVGRYFRLMLLSALDIMFSLPLSISAVYLSNHNVPLEPWISWEETHFDFGRVVRVPAMFWRGNGRMELSLELTRWLPVMCAFLFFALFGCASEARKSYVGVFIKAKTFVGLKNAKIDRPPLPVWAKPLKLGSSSPSTANLPIFTAYSSQELCISRPSSSVALSNPSFIPPIPPPQYSRPQPSHVPLDVTFSEDDIHIDMFTPFCPIVFSEHDLSQQVDTNKTPNKKRDDRSSSNTLPPSPELRIRPPLSPPYHRPFCSPSVYPATQSHPNSHGLIGAIQITIHTHHSQDTL